MGRAAFLPHEDVLDPLLIEQRVINGEHRPAGIAEHNFHTLIIQGLNQNIGAGHFGRHDEFPYCKNKGSKQDITNTRVDAALQQQRIGGE